MRRLARRAALLLPLLALGCGVALEAPPIELAYRDSLVGAGKILRIKNTSSETLTDLRIEIAAEGHGERSFTQESLGGYQTLEVGWKKLGGWEVPAGAEVSIRCAGYLLSFSGELPPEAAAEG